MNRFILAAALFLSPMAFAAGPAPAAECTCKDHGAKCEGGCCTACNKDSKNKECACKDDQCKSCPTCNKKKAK